MRTELTNLHCQKAAPGPKRYRLSDKGGLCLMVMPTGGKLWRYQYTFEGKMKELALGKYPDVSLAQARVLHAQARAARAGGVDPMALRKEAKADKEATHAQNETEHKQAFAALARQWYAWWKSDKAWRYAEAVERRMENDVIPAIGHKRPEDVTRLDIIELTQATDARGAREIAQRNLQFIALIFEWAVNNGHLDNNFRSPVAGIRPHLILKRVVKNSIAYLEIEEIPELLRRMRAYGGQQLTKLAMELLALTFVRTSDLINARWEEIDWQSRQWRIPLARMKMKRKHSKTKDYHVVPLSRQAVKVLKQVETLSGKRDFIFPDFSEGMRPMSNNTILKALERMGYKGKMTGHGWRSVASTYLNNHGFLELWVEAQLAHEKTDRVAGAYNHALYLEHRAKMMQHWADFLDQCRENGTAKTVKVA